MCFTKPTSLLSYSLAIAIFLCCISQGLAYSPIEIAELAKPATVGVYASVNDDKYYGTGVIISEDGIILTSTTVVPENSELITIYFEDHTSLPAKIIEYSLGSQSVLLKVQAPPQKRFPYLTLQKRLPELANPVYTLGNASNMIKLGDGVSFSAGVVSGLYEVPVSPPIPGKQKMIQVIETDAAVNDGQDGGGLINSNGEIIGIISKDYSKMRWQGTAIPSGLIINDFKYFKTATNIKISDNQTLQVTNTFKVIADKLRQNIVKIHVNRLYPPEVLDFPEWSNYKAAIPGWDKLSKNEQRRLVVDFFSTESLISANQMLRRPEGPVTGLVISPEGYIITSAFNVESLDTAFVDKRSRQIKSVRYKGSIEKLLHESQSNIDKVSNRVLGVSITLADGTEVPASIVGFSTPLGLALLKTDTLSVPSFYDISNNYHTPVLGERIAVLGAVENSYTINTGIVSAASRDNGNYFQIDALLNYGNSGGPVINAKGDFLGLAARPLTPSPISGSILPFSGNNTTNNLLPSLKDFTSTPNSGISMIIMAHKIIESLPKLIAGEGINVDDFISLGLFASKDDPYSSEIVVGSIAKDSPAEKAGFKKGDIIKEMDGIGIRSWSEINNYVSQKKEGQVIIFSIRRPLDKPYILLNGKKITNSEEFFYFLKNNNDGAKVSGHISSPGINQKLYVTLK